MRITDNFAALQPNVAPTFREGTARCISRRGFHNIYYRDWGPADADRHVLCIHGLTRNGSDFEPLAAALSPSFRIICPDLAGRGRSDWLENPADYNLLQYNMDVVVLAARTLGDQFDLVGTSLGGLMGISLAGIANTPIRRLVVNDVAPEVPYSALSRIIAYGGMVTQFADLASVERHLRTTLAPFGPMTDDDWKRMAKNSARRRGDRFVLHHDPDIFQNFGRLGMFTFFDLWKQWESIRCPVLVLRGKNSDFLTERLLARMKERLPHMQAIEFEGVGHTPTLNAPSQIEPVREWLESA
jgi:pimeloyl-ACP methyl ester carboxylesterase